MMGRINVFKFAFTFLAFLPGCLFADMLDLTQSGTKKSPIVLDLDSQDVNLNVSSQKPGIVYVKLKNILPMRKGDYAIAIEQEAYAVEPFDKSQFVDEGTGNKAFSQFDSSNPAISCDYLADQIKLITGIKKQDQFQQFLAERQGLSDWLTSYNKLTGSPKNSFDASMTTGCPNNIAVARDIVDAETGLMVRFRLEDNSRADFKVSLDGENLASMTIATKKRRWVTHVGFTFMDNKDESYYSQKLPDDTYRVQRKDTSGELSYTATMLFTYPHLDLKNGYLAGPSVGLGASNDSISVLMGFSILFNENFVLSGGMAIREFDTLSGSYYSKQNLGTDPVDSADLTDKTYKATPMITFGYKFAQ